MSVADEITRIKGNIASAYTAAGAKGATIPDVQNSANLAGCIDTITGGGGEPVNKTKFGASIDNLMGGVDEDGNYILPTERFDAIFDGVITLSYDGGQRLLGNKETVDNVFFPQLKVASFYYSFYYSSISNLIVDCLEEIGSTDAMCSGAKNLTKAYFPSLVRLSNGTNTFGSSSTNSAFASCSNMTEIHFRSDMQAEIEALKRYSYKFGATNSTIYFDLIGAITVDGVEYKRSEINSIRNGFTKLYVAWSDGAGNVIYTDATAEPAVGTAVYSDQGTTQVGTVEGVA